MTRDAEEDDLVLDDGEDEEPFAVLLRRRQTWSFPEVSEALQVQAMISVADAARAARKRPGILLPSVSEEIARDVVRALRALEVDCFMVREGDLFPPPVPLPVERLELLDDGLRASLAAHGGAVASCPWGNVAMIAAAHISSGSPGGDVYTAVKRQAVGSLAGRKQVLAFGREVKHRDFYAIDVYCGYTRRGGPEGADVVLHVDSMQFDFACLGPARVQNAPPNVKELVTRLAQRAPDAALSQGAAALVEGDPRAATTFDNLVEFQQDCLWQLDLLELERRKRAREGASS